MIASDWNSTGPAPSTSAGISICGFTVRKASSRCLPFIKSTSMTSSGTMPLRLSAIRTRNVASERQNENSFTGPLLQSNGPDVDPAVLPCRLDDSLGQGKP